MMALSRQGIHMEADHMDTMIIYKEATNCGGLVSGEHGIGSGKVKYLVDSVGETNMAIMEGIKRVFDPKMILNPGKVCYRL
jgi:glycolate oxidase